MAPKRKAGNIETEPKKTKTIDSLNLENVEAVSSILSTDPCSKQVDNEVNEAEDEEENDVEDDDDDGDDDGDDDDDNDAEDEDAEKDDDNNDAESDIGESNELAIENSKITATTFYLEEDIEAILPINEAYTTTEDYHLRMAQSLQLITEFVNNNPQKCKEIKRGDLISTDSKRYRNNGVYLWDGEKAVKLADKIDDYGHIPSTYIVSDEEFSPFYWIDQIDHNSIYYPCEAYRESVISTYDDDVYEGYFTHRGDKHYLSCSEDDFENIQDSKRPFYYNGKNSGRHESSLEP